MAKKSDYKKSVNITAVERALSVMETICYEDGEMGISEIASKMGEYPSTIYRVISTMMAHGYLYQNPVSSKYGLSYKIYILGRNVEKNSSLINISKTYADDLAQELMETVNVSVRDSSVSDSYNAITIYQKTGGNRALTVSERTGQSYECYNSAVGKVLMAYSKDAYEEKIRKIKLVRFTETTITDIEAFIKELNDIRIKGYAIDNQERETGLYCVAYPLLDRDGSAILAVSVSGLKANIQEHGIDNIVRKLKDICDEMRRKIV